MMRTNIEIDDKLMKEAMRSANTKTKRENGRGGLAHARPFEAPGGYPAFAGKNKMGRKSRRAPRQPVLTGGEDAHCGFHCLGGLL
jgi:hypothetical protein